MGIARGPRIVKDGLVFHIDVASERCYTNNSSTINDLSNSEIIGAVVSEPIFDSIPGSLTLPREANSWITGSGLFISGSPFTIDIWLKAIDLSNTVAHIFFSVGDTSALRQAIHLRQYSNTSMRFGMWADDFDVTTADNTNEWVNYTFTLDSNFTQSIYENTSLLNTRGAGGYFEGSDDWGIGVWSLGATRQEAFSGSIGSVKCYDRVLTQQEIEQNYNAFKTRYIEQDSILPLNPDVYFTPTSIDPSVTTSGSSISTWYDLSKNGFNATIGAGTVNLNIGSTGRQIEFTGGNSWMDIASSSVYGYTPGTDEFTIVVREGDNYKTVNTGYWVALASDGSTNRIYAFGRGAVTDKDYFLNVGGGTTWIGDYTGSLSNGNVLHIAVVTTGSITVYSDGAQPTILNSGGIGSTVSVAASLNLGGRSDGGFLMDDGTQMDLVALIPKAITEAERLAIEAQYKVN